jgi:hypothetical protein
MSLEVARPSFRLTAGKPRFWSRATDSGGRLRCAFCPDCGSRVWHESARTSDTITVKAGSLDSPINAASAIHIWVKRKLPGIEIPSEAVQFPEEPM